MKSIKIDWQGETRQLKCRMAELFPPPNMTSMLIDEWGDLEEQRKNKKINTTEYQQSQVWQRVCGLQEMWEEKCLGCSNCLFEKGVNPTTMEIVWKAILDVEQRPVSSRSK